jgi:hypothetical protein
MKRILVGITYLAIVSLLSAAPALAQNPHFISGPNTTCSGTCLEVNFKVSGLGNVPQTTYSISCSSITVTGQCFTSSGNPVQGTTKSGTATGSNSGTLAVHNGTTSGPISLCPANLTLNFSPGCTGSQEFRISSASYSGCTLTVDGISQDSLSQTCPL